MQIFNAAKRWLARFFGCNNGNVAILAAASAPMVLVLMALAIDQGSLYLERRELQGLADLAAIQASANPANAVPMALATLKDNGFPDAIPQPEHQAQEPGGPRIVLTARTGRYRADPGILVGERFQPAPPGQSNAVRVTLEKVGRIYFASAFMAPPQISVSAVASSNASAAFSVGSRLASLNEGVLNSALGGMLGTTISLSVMDYNALLSADIEVLRFLDALAVELNLSAASYNDVLGASATVGDIVAAMASLDGIGSPARLALQAMGLQLPASGVLVPISSLVDLGPVGSVAVGNHGSGFGAEVGLMEMLTAGAIIAGRGRQVDLGLDLGIPGIAAMNLKLAIGEPPQSAAWFVIGDEAGVVARTAQTRLRLAIELGNVGQALGGGISLLSVRLPIYAEVAHAEARLVDVSCVNGRSDTVEVSIATRPGIANVRIGESASGNFDDFSSPLVLQPAKIADVSIKILLINLPLINILGSAAVASENLEPQVLTFDRWDIDAGTVKTVYTHNISQSLVLSLLDDLTLQVNALGLPIDISSLLSTVRPVIVAVLSPLSGALDNVIYNVLSTLGLRVGEADVRVHGATCGRPVLVQ